MRYCLAKKLDVALKEIGEIEGEKGKENELL